MTVSEDNDLSGSYFYREPKSGRELAGTKFWGVYIHGGH